MAFKTFPIEFIPDHDEKCWRVDGYPISIRFDSSQVNNHTQFLVSGGMRAEAGYGSLASAKTDAMYRAKEMTEWLESFE